MKTTISRAGICCIATLMSNNLFADDLTIPNTFQSNTPARAADVNANFSAVEASVDDNAADIEANISAIATNESSIQSLNASVAALSNGGVGLSVLFYNQNPNANLCDFVHLPSNKHFWWNSNETALRITVSSVQSGDNFFVLTNIATIEDARVALIDLMIRIGNLPLTVEDFRDAASGQFDCTNEKLLSLL